MSTISPALMERVDAGVAWADEHIPGWRNYVDPKKLDMGDAHKCVLGQYWRGFYGYGEFYTAFLRMFDSNPYRTEELGFSTSGSYDELTEAWRQKFRELGMLSVDDG